MYYINLLSYAVCKTANCLFAIAEWILAEYWMVHAVHYNSSCPRPCTV